MTLDQMRSLLAVARHLSFRIASRELHLTQSAVSKQLTSLQDELGAKLYTRNGPGTELTEAGRAALTKVEPILKQVDELQEMFHRNVPQAQQPVILSVTAAFSIAANVLPQVIARFEKSHSGVEVNCHTGSSGQIQQLIRVGRAEIGLSTQGPLTGDIDCEPFRVQSLVFFVNSAHPLATRRHVTLSDVLAYPLVVRSVMGGPTWTHNILKQLSEQGLKSKVALECNGPLQVKEAVARNIGVGLSYIDNLKADVASGRLVVLKGRDFQFTTLSYIVYSKKRGLSPLAQDFLALLREAKRIPKEKDLREITNPIKNRVFNLARKNTRLIWILLPVIFYSAGLPAQNSSLLRRYRTRRYQYATMIEDPHRKPQGPKNRFFSTKLQKPAGSI